MTPSTKPSAATPPRRIHRFIWLGVALLIVTFIGASKSLPTGNDHSTSDKPASNHIRPGGTGYWDLETGVTHLYPLHPGRVVEVFKTEGDEAREGEPLFRLDDQLPRKDWERAKNAVEAAEVQLKRAKDAVRVYHVKYDAEVKVQKETIAAKKGKADAARAKAAQAKRLADGGNASEEDATAAEKAVLALDAEVRAEEAKLKGMEALKEPVDLNLQVDAAERALAGAKLDESKAKIAVDECVVKAPKKGQVLRSFVRVGESLGPNPTTPAMEYACEGKRIVRAEIEQEFDDGIHVGQTAMVQDDTRASTVYNGTVIRVSPWQARKRDRVPEPLVFNDVRTLEVLIELDGQPPLKIGQRMRVKLD
jgi:multidrug resistance efflux pump